MATNELAKMVVKLEAQTAKFQRKMEQAEGKVKRFEKNSKRSLNRIRGNFSSILGGIALGAFGKKIIDATATQQRALKQLEQGWKSTGGVVGLSVDEIVKEAERLQGVSIFGNEQIAAAQSQLLTFTKITGEQFKKVTIAALDLSTRMDQDLKSSVVQLGKALNDPIANLSALSRTGIQFSADQKSVIKSLVETNRLAEAQEVILKELEVQFGGSALAAREDFGGALTGVSNALGDLLEGAGGLEENIERLHEFEAVLKDPSTVQAAETLTGALITGFSEFVVLLGNGISGTKALAEEMARIVNGGADVSSAIADLAQLQSLGANLSNPGISNRANRNQEIIESMIGFSSLEDLEGFLDRVESEINDTFADLADGANTPQDEAFLQHWVAVQSAIESAIMAKKEFGDVAVATPNASPEQPLVTNQEVFDPISQEAFDDVAKYIEKMRDLATAFTEATDPQAQFSAQLKELNDVQMLGGLGIDAYNAKLAEYREELAIATPGIQSLKELNEALTDTLTPQQAALEKVRAEMEMLVDAMALFPEKSDQITSALQRLQAEETEIISKSKDLSNEMSAFADQAARNMQDAFADFLFDPFQDGLDGMLEGFLKVIQEMLAQQLAAQLFGSTADGGFGLGDAVSGLLSFDGGGSTGSGSRTGGVDGKGGFPAILHPQETVVDHTKNLQPMSSAPVVNVPPPEVIVVDSIEKAFEAMSSPRGANIQMDNAKKNSTKFNQSLGNS